MSEASITSTSHGSQNSKKRIEDSKQNVPNSKKNQSSMSSIRSGQSVDISDKKIAVRISDVSGQHRSYSSPTTEGTSRPRFSLQVGLETTALDLGEKGGKPTMIKYMNTFRLESNNPFRKEPVYNIIRDVFKTELETMNYEPAILSKACAVIASEIRNRVKALGYERYKLVCVVQVCEKNRQSVNSISKFLWDPEKDNCASYSYENMYFLAAGAVFGLYFE